jgi:uncharacterized protein YjdB
MRTITPTARSRRKSRYNTTFLFVLFILFAWGNNVFAQQRSEAEALAIAQQFLSANGHSTSSNQLKMVSRSAIDKQIRRHAPSKNPLTASAFYIVNDEASDRFVIVSSDERLQDVLGYSEKGIIIPDSMPCGMAAMLESYNREYAYILEHGITTKTQRAPRKIKAVSPLIKTDWGQHGPIIDGKGYWLYNLECPKTQNGYCSTGCVATAMAQIMNYHKYPSRGQGTKSYTSINNNLKFNLSINFADKSFDWSNMLDTYKYGVDKQEQIDAVSYLMKACGYSVNMVYGEMQNGGSAAHSSDVPYAMINYFKYNPNMVYYAENYYSSEEWEMIIQEELSNKRPIIYSAADPDYKGKVAGHAFILDGCDSSGYYHFNWGWDGDFDNYFLLSLLNPDDYNFSADRGMVCRICQQTIGNHEDTFYTDNFEIEGWEDGYTMGETATLKMLRLHCFSSDANSYDTPFSGYLGYYILPNEGKARGIYTFEISINNAHYRNSLFPYGEISFDSEVFKEGSEYTILPVVFNSSLNRVTRIRTLGGKTDYYVAKVINGKVKLYLKGQDTSTSYPNIDITSIICQNNNPLQLTKDDELKLTATFKNNGGAGNAKTVPVIMAKDKQSIVKWGDIKDNYYDASQILTLNYSISLVDVPEGNYYGTVLSYNEKKDGWLYSNDCLIDVCVIPKAIPVNKITLSQTSATLTKGQTLQLTASVQPTNATNKEVAWTSSNKNVATVSSTGLVTAVAAGTATITCTANDGSGVKATCSVTVKPDIILVNKITLNQISATLTTGGTLQLTATVLPENATDKTVTWSTSNKNVATVSNTGLVMAVAEGTATITCTANDGSGVKATCTVTVESLPNSYSYPYLASLVCQNGNPLQLTPNDELKLKATFGNDGSAGNVLSIPIIVPKNWNKTFDTIVKMGDKATNYFAASPQNTIVNYNLTLSDVPVGEYYATVMFYIESDDEEKEGWYYNGNCMVEIIVLPFSPDNILGDVNGDGEVNGTDGVVLVNIILGRSENRPAADVNGDGEVNGTDYVALVNIILNRSYAPSKSFDFDENTFAGTSNLWIEPFTINAGEEKTMTIDLWNPDDEITLVQYDLRLPEGLSLKMIGDEYEAGIAGRTDRESHSLSTHAIDGTTHFVLASHNNASFTGTDGAIIRMTLVADENYQGGTVSVENILLVTPREQETRPGDLTLGIKGIFVDQKTDKPVYNVAGQRLYVPRKGINIINGKKIVVK